ncbi:DEKNAAC100636 [Brettanomyces naardenensis]|uniref:DEKNAAC100636 n=1 Tax=Brettanomyces naardenensis TaxID=13370 RepID=A0A448YG05_BRENA|nr:DEKNAAC100636 [Brettanomyces naardenensis]
MDALSESGRPFSFQCLNVPGVTSWAEQCLLVEHSSIVSQLSLQTRELDFLPVKSYFFYGNRDVCYPTDKHLGTAITLHKAAGNSWTDYIGHDLGLTTIKLDRDYHLHCYYSNNQFKLYGPLERY